MPSDTRQRILNAALEMFAEQGYRGTNLRDLAASLKLSKSALYRHFESKQAIWEALVDDVDSYYRKSLSETKGSASLPKTLEEFEAMALEQVKFTMNDRRIVLVRKVLSQEQFHDQRAASLATEHFRIGLVEMLSVPLAELMSSGVIAEDDPEALAFEFSAPITVLIHEADREPHRRDEISNEVSQFVKRFCERMGTRQ